MIAFKCFCPKYSVIIQDLVAYNLKATDMHEVVSESWTCYFNFDTCGFLSASVLSINIVIMCCLNSYTKESGHELTEKTKGLYSRTNQHLRFPGLQIIVGFFMCSEPCLSISFWRGYFGCSLKRDSLSFDATDPVVSRHQYYVPYLPEFPISALLIT